MTRNEIISQLFTSKNFNNCLAKIESARLREDLRQEVILIICELPESLLQQLHERNCLEFYTVRIILNQGKSKTSPFARKFKLHQEAYYEDTSTVPIGTGNGNIASKHAERILFQVNEKMLATTIIDIEERKQQEAIEDMAIKEIDNLYWYNKGLIELYMELGNFRAVQSATKIPVSSCYATIKKSFQEIKAKVL